jgi:hypothetical protein
MLRCGGKILKKVYPKPRENSCQFSRAVKGYIGKGEEMDIIKIN